MSCNCYWASEPVLLPTGEEVRLDREDPRVHIGKAAAGTFAWAQPRSQVEAAGEARPDEDLIADERGEWMTVAEFLRRIEGLEDRDKLGCWFF